jgi:DNA-binding transcriptional LysR family regulator
VERAVSGSKPSASGGFVLALSGDSWLCRLPQISPAHLQNETFILPEQISGTLQVAAQGRFAPTLRAQPGGLVAVIALVSLGQGVAVVPESVVGHVGLPGVVYRRIEGCEASSWLSMVIGGLRSRRWWPGILNK